MKKLFLITTVATLCLPAFAFAATTISTDINTGGTLTATGHAAIGNLGGVDSIVWGYGTPDEHAYSFPTTLNINDYITGDLGAQPRLESLTLYPSYTNTGSTPNAGLFAIESQPTVNSASTGNIGYLEAGTFYANNYGTGDVGYLVGITAGAEHVSTSGTVDQAVAVWATPPENYGDGTITNTTGLYVSPPVNGGGGTIVNDYGLWIADQSGAATNAYYSWFDSRGVRRVKEDNTFNSVGQAIEALYNPQFTKYTPGATNYERLILGEWNSNVAQIGTEKGGTGAARPLALMTDGSQRLTITADGNVGIGATSPTSLLQVATSSSNATSSVEFGKSGQNKGSCIVMYDASGAVKYLSIQAGALVVSATSCK